MIPKALHCTHQSYTHLYNLTELAVLKSFSPLELSQPSKPFSHTSVNIRKPRPNLPLLFAHFLSEHHYTI